MEEPNGPFIPLILKICMSADVTDNDNAEIPTLANLISAHFTDADCLSVLASVGEPNTRFNVDSDEMIVPVSPLDSTSN